MTWLEAQRAAKAAEHASIKAVRDAYAHAGITLNDKEKERNFFNAEELGRIDFDSLESLVRHKYLEPPELFMRGSLKIDFGIYCFGDFVYANCHVPEVDEDMCDEPPVFTLGQELSWEDFLKQQFEGSISILCTCSSLNEIPDAIRRVNETLNALVAFVGE